MSRRISGARFTSANTSMVSAVPAGEVMARLDWQEPLVADKHCIGGISGTRTSMLIVPIVAAPGMMIPKTSSRAITSPAGFAVSLVVFVVVFLVLVFLRVF